MAAMKNTENGFTLVELMTAMAMAGIVLAVISAAYNIQTKIYTEQDKTAEMQQNIRAGMVFMQREARAAGYDTEDENDVSCGAGGVVAAAPGIHTATATEFGFSMDLDEDGKCDGTGENVTYAIYTADGIQKLGRKAPAINAPVAENIDGINFVYFSSSAAPTSSPATLKDIVAVQVSLLARVSTPDRKAPRTVTFTVPMPDALGVPTAGTSVIWGPFNDSINRRLLTTTINCRNMGLN